MRTETALYVLISLLNLPFLTLSAGRVWFPVFRSVPAADPRIISAALICRTLEISGTQGIPFFSDCTNFNVRDKILGSPHSDIDILQFSSDTF